MADTTGTAATTPASSETAKPAPSRAQTRRKTASTNRSTAAKKAAATRARNQASVTRKRSAAAKKAAETRRERERTPVERYIEVAERAVNIQVGAALVARDNVVELANKYSSLDKVEQELRAQRARIEKDLRTFERRGTTVRTQLERRLRDRTQRVERELRGVGSDAGAQVGLVGARVENIVQSGVTAGTQVAAKVTERVARVA
jgi:biotin operon repressor